MLWFILGFIAGFSACVLITKRRRLTSRASIRIPLE